MIMTNFGIFVASIKLKFLDIFLADKNILCSIFCRHQSFGMEIQNWWIAFLGFYRISTSGRNTWRKIGPHLTILLVIYIHRHHFYGNKYLRIRECILSHWCSFSDPSRIFETVLSFLDHIQGLGYRDSSKYIHLYKNTHRSHFKEPLPLVQCTVSQKEDCKEEKDRTVFWDICRE